MNAVTRCPACRARLRAGDTWCGQCHTDLRPPPPRVPVPRAAAAPAPPSGPPTGQASGLPAGPSSGRPDDVGALAEAWARRLAESERGAGLPGFAGVTRDRAARAGVAVGAAVAVVVLVLGGMALLGVLL